MTHNTPHTTETEAIEFTAAYGTAVVMTGTCRSSIHNHQPETLAGSSGTPANRPNIATGTDRHPGGPNFLQPDDKALNPVQAPTRQSIPLAAANDAGKHQGKRPQLRGDLNRRRKAA